MKTCRLVAGVFSLVIIFGFCRPAAANSPDGSFLLPRSGGGLLTNAGTWAFSTSTGGGGNLILLNGSNAAAAGGSGLQLLIANGGNLYAFNNAGLWYEWNEGSLWTRFSSTPFPISPNGSTMVPGATTDLVTSAGIWAFSSSTGTGGNLILLNGSNVAAAGGSAVELMVDNGGKMNYFNNAGQQYQWNGSAWVEISAPISLICASAVVVGIQWTAVPSATSYTVVRNGTALGSTALLTYTDQTVTASTVYTYAVEAFDGVSMLSTQSIGLTTPAASANGDPAYCPSAAIAGMTWNWPTGFNQQNGSDLWPATWGADGNTYFFWGDGPGYLESGIKPHTSFGIGELTASAPAVGSAPVLTAGNALNVYGGTNPVHPSTIYGKANGLIAIGSNFYAVGAIYERADGTAPPYPSNEPNHYEIVYSIGNPYSWVDNGTNWQFCSDKTSPSGFCAISFVNFGAGNAGAIDNYVYLLGATEENFIGNGGSCACTYLARVPKDELLTQSAYQVYTGVDASGVPQWSSTWTDMQPIFVDHGPRPLPIGKVVYNSVLQRFIGVGQGFVNQAAFYDAPNPWGPWTSIGYYNSNLDGTGGWGNLGTTSFGAGTGDALGINFMNAWTSSDGLTMWATFSSDGIASSNADLRALQGQSMDSFSLVSVTLSLVP